MPSSKDELKSWYDAEISKTEKLIRSSDGDMADRWKLEQLRKERDNLPK